LIISLITSRSAMLMRPLRYVPTKPISCSTKNFF